MVEEQELDTPVLILDTNKDVNYDKDEGDEWITKISDFITELQQGYVFDKNKCIGSPESKISKLCVVGQSISININRLY